MNDLVSRQALLDKFEPWLKVKDYNDGELNMLKAILYEIRFMRQAQPEIIHCGECTKMEVDSVFHDCWCGETRKKVWINHYCGYAERREVTE